MSHAVALPNASQVPALRVRPLNERPIRERCEYVLYWMTAFRRLSWNYALDLAMEWARELDRPLLILEALRAGYPRNCDRFHQFALEGMQANLRDAAGRSVSYYPYAEPVPGAGKGLLQALAERACLVVADDYPCFFLPKMVTAARAKLDAATFAVDSNGLLPLRGATKVFERAVDFRRFLQKELPRHLGDRPNARPLSAELPDAIEFPRTIADRWPSFAERLAAGDWKLPDFPIDRSVRPVDSIKGGSAEGQSVWKRFLDDRMERYLDERNLPDANAASGLSPYLHWGYFSPHQAFHDLANRDGWSAEKLAAKPQGKREGWWGMSPEAEAFLDELITWRELGFNRTWQTDDYDEYESLPAWARKTLDEHRQDPRSPTYSLSEMERAETYDPLWNASQRQLVREGRIHNYMRMLWGKKILEWSATPEEAVTTMIELNDKYALDGRDPNSYSGILWTLGRYDRAWGPERPIFGKIRYMSSANTARKFSVANYLATYAAAEESS